jgi:hypothetical protein
MDVGLIRDGLKARAETISGLRGFDTVPSGDVPIPAAVVVPDEPFITYPETIKRGFCTLNFIVTLLASEGRVGQDLIDGYLSSGTGETSSVVDAIEGDRTLGGSASTCVVTQAGQYGQAEVAGIVYSKADLKVAVTAGRA